MASLIIVRQRYNESLLDFISRFRTKVAEIPNLTYELNINYLALGVDKSRLELLLAHRLTLQEVVGSIQSPQPTTLGWDHDQVWDEKLTLTLVLLGKIRNKIVHHLHNNKPGTTSTKNTRTWQPRPWEEKEYTKLNTNKELILTVLKIELGCRPPRLIRADRPPSSK